MLIKPLGVLPNGELRQLRDDLTRKRERDNLENLWARFEPYADSHFINEISSESMSKFQSRFWEMYLSATCLELGLDLRSRHELGKEGPDICIVTSETNIWIEAIASGADFFFYTGADDGCEPIDESAILRYCGAITEKFRKYNGYLKNGIVLNSEPYIIAVNGFHIPFSISGNTSSNMLPNIIKAVAPFGDYQVILDRDAKQIIKTGYSYRDKIVKPSGGNVPTNIFGNPEYAGISAILFSNIGISNLPDKCGDDFLFFRNPMAINPLNAGWLKVGVEYWQEGNKLFKKRQEAVKNNLSDNNS
ncbi:MAG: hypothetical protein Q7T89_17545 [Anaerolineales bacterium]|nr:hypothetical protein [Anaerolineales bacterium]